MESRKSEFLTDDTQFHGKCRGYEIVNQDEADVDSNTYSNYIVTKTKMIFKTITKQ